MWHNKTYFSIPNTKQLFHEYVESYDFEFQPTLPYVRDLERFFDQANNVSFKVLHPLFFQGWKTPMLRFKDHPIKLAGLDVESDYKTGQPMLVGIYWPEPNANYQAFHKPTLKILDSIVWSCVRTQSQLICWGNFDIQAILRILEPTEQERSMISRGLSANHKQGIYPLIRDMGSSQLFISHYLSRRSLKFGVFENNNPDRVYSVWLFNCSQFFPGTIRENTVGLNLPWVNYPENTHLVNWPRYNSNLLYRNLVHLSNRQDAYSVQQLALNLQSRFAKVFQCYPSLLVSNGSLTDTAVSKMLEDDPEDYKATNQKWIESNIWSKTNTDEEIQDFNLLLSEAFSAGYVDQFGIGYYKSVWSTDLSSAYPSVIRKLPDLRYSFLRYGTDNLDNDWQDTAKPWTAIISGDVTIPNTLKFHPITMKSYHRENIRPTGTFRTSYTYQERAFCKQYGATFENEEYFIVCLTENHLSPLADVSERLGNYRDQLIHEAKIALKETKTMLDGQQFVVKVIDNSLYGKTVQTMETVEDVNGIPTITGYIGGDRYNLLYGTIITASVRCKIADLCMTIAKYGGKPIMTMTDAVYWVGNGKEVPKELIRETKTPGFFEPPHEVFDFYLLKTGQYEYRTEQRKWKYLLRGLNVDYSNLTGTHSFYRRVIKEYCSGLLRFTHPKDIRIPIPAKKLITIGSKDLDRLALIDDSPIELRPFLLSDKQAERWIKNWHDLLDGNLSLAQPHIIQDRKQLDFLDKLYKSEQSRIIKDRTVKESMSQKTRKEKQDREKLIYIIHAWEITGKKPPEGRSYRLPWNQLIEHYGIPRDQSLTEHASTSTTSA